MAEGFLCESNGSKSMESQGRECFEELVSRSFFLNSTIDKSLYTMHDLINDLAKSVAGEFFIMLDDRMDVDERNEALEKLHHFSIIRQNYGVYRKFKALQRAKCLRTFLAVSVMRLDTWQLFSLSNMILDELLPRLQLLRVLNLAHFSMTEVPKSIGSLKHMRYLNFSRTNIICLPDEVGDLYNLQSLLVSSCHCLSSLPNSLLKLRNLRHLDISDTPNLNKMPLGIGGLAGLQTLSKVIIGEADEFKLSDLKSLLHLQGGLYVKRLDRVINAIHAKDADLQQKKGLRVLKMEWSDVFDESRNEITDYEVLEGLRPYEKLRSLKILYYMGTEFPRWVGDPSFACLKQLTLRGCRSCTYLPTLGHLPSLQKLSIESMNGLTILGSELLGPTNGLLHSISFPSLEVLKFKHLQGWREWSTNGGGIDRTTASFPCLSEISIKNCPQLDVVEIGLIPSLRVLHLHGCSVAVIRSMVGMSSSILKLTMWNIKGLTKLHEEMFEHLRAVKYLNIQDCNELIYSWESNMEECKIPVSLQKLVVSACVNLLSLVSNTESLREVELYNCDRLEIYHCPNSIEKLEISCCHSITSLTFPTVMDFQSTLKILNISLCGNLEVSWLQNNFLSSLESLSIRRMPNLRLFPEGCLVHLTKLTISGCDNIESIPDNGYGFLPFFCLRYLGIYSCKNLKSFPHEHMQSLTTMEELSINDCPSMDYSFPCGLWPPNLSTLTLGGLKKPISEWGQQYFPTSLVQLHLYGNSSGMVPFAKAEDVMNSNNTTSSFLVPQSLTYLVIYHFLDLKSLSKCLQHLTCLEKFDIWSCPKLSDLPETLLPQLSSLKVRFCPKLEKKCRNRKGKYWSAISQIPYVEVG